MATPHVPPPEDDAGSRLSGCVAVLLIAGVLFVLGAVWFYLFGKNYFADSARDAIVQVIQDSAIPEGEQSEMIEQIDRLNEAFKAGQVGYAAMAQVLTELVDSPVMAVLAVVALETNYVLPSGLSEDEKAAAHLALERVARGLIEERITEEDLAPALDVISTTENGSGERVLKERLSDDELRAFLNHARQLADGAGIPDVPMEVDLGDALRDAIDRALAAEGASEAETSR